MPDNKQIERIRTLLQQARSSAATLSFALEEIEEELQVISGEVASHNMQCNQISKPLRPVEGESMPIEKKKLLTVKEAAVVLGLNPRSVFRIISKGKLRVCRFSKRTVRIPRKELDRFIEASISGGK